MKPDRLKQINELFEDNINYQNETKIKNYYLSTNIEFNGNTLNAFKYISNININDKNIKEIVSMERKRWKIETEGFYTQKHGTFNISHISSRNDKAMK